MILRVSLIGILLALLGAALADGAAAKPFMNGLPSPKRVQIIYAPCPDVGGSCTRTDLATIWLSSRREFARQHELFHLADNQLLTDAERDTLRPYLRVPGSTPWGGTTGEDCWSTQCPNEIAADAYASCRLDLLPQPPLVNGRREGGWETSYGYTPRTNREQQRTCAALRSALDDDAGG